MIYEKQGRVLGMIWRIVLEWILTRFLGMLTRFLWRRIRPFQTLFGNIYRTMQCSKNIIKDLTSSYGAADLVVFEKLPKTTFMSGSFLRSDVGLGAFAVRLV
jgi:hypothetical protein